eukprot:12127.XXX_335556_330278_1 [CDS] Oithona nana genome sequencing.
MERSENRRNRIGGQMAGLYDLEETIGEGHYAVVKMARHVFTGEKVAVKVIDKMKLDSATRLQMMQEVRLMKLVQHPYVVRLYEVIDTQTKLYLVLEFADGGDMYDYIMKHEGGLDENTAKKYFRQIVTAIQYCHKLHVVHRDLKPENVVFFEKLGMVKLTDFGFSNKFDPGQRLQTSCGSLAYSAPEILLGDSYDAPAVDIWSLGVILYMLVCGTAPFQEANDSETLTMIMDCKYSFPSHISQTCKSLISRMLQRQPEVRASLEDIVSDSWLTEEDDIPEEEMFPLVSREHLTEEEHSSVLQRMVNGAIAHRDDIIAALDRNEYNHITATYFLLAERKLRMQRSDQHAKTQAGPGRNQGKLASQSSLEAKASLKSEATTGAADKAEKTKNLPPLSSPMMEGLLTPSEVAAARRKCTIVEEDEEEEVDVKPAAVCDDSGLKTMSRSSSTDYPAATLDLASVWQNFTAGTKPLLPPDASEPIEPTPAPFPLASQIGTGLSRQNSLRRSETSGSNSGAASPATTPPGSTPSSSQGSPARYKLGSGRKLANTRSSPQLILNQIHEEAEEGGAQSHIDPVLDNFPQTSAGAVVIRRLEQRRKLRLHKSRTTSCSSSDASDDENAGSENARDSKRHPRPEKTPTPPPIGKEPHDDSSDSNQDPGASTVNNPSASMASLTLTSRSRSRTNESHTPQTGKGPSNDEGSEPGGSGDAPHVLNSSSSRRNRSHLQQARVRQSRSLNRISELHVVADFSENEDMLTRYLDSVNVNRGATRSRDDSLTSSDGEFEAGQSSQPSSQQSQRRTKVNLRLLEQRLNKIQEESLHNLKNDDEIAADDPDEEAGGTDGDVSDNVSTVADDFSTPNPLLSCPNTTTTKSILIEDKENQTTCLSETTSVKSCVVTTSSSSNKKPQHPRLNRAHSCGSLFSLKERALLRKKLSSHVTAAFLDILSNSTNASEVVTEVNKKQQTDLTLALKTNPLAVFQLQSSRCCNLC